MTYGDTYRSERRQAHHDLLVTAAGIDPAVLTETVEGEGRTILDFLAGWDELTTDRLVELFTAVRTAGIHEGGEIWRKELEAAKGGERAGSAVAGKWSQGSQRSPSLGVPVDAEAAVSSPPVATGAVGPERAGTHRPARPGLHVGGET